LRRYCAAPPRGGPVFAEYSIRLILPHIALHGQRQVEQAHFRLFQTLRVRPRKPDIPLLSLAHAPRTSLRGAARRLTADCGIRELPGASISAQAGFLLDISQNPCYYRHSTPPGGEMSLRGASRQAPRYLKLRAVFGSEARSRGNLLYRLV
jgi:hypothetical protein